MSGIPYNTLAANWGRKHAKRVKAPYPFLTISDCGKTYTQQNKVVIRVGWPTNLRVQTPNWKRPALWWIMGIF